MKLFTTMAVFNTDPIKMLLPIRTCATSLQYQHAFLAAYMRVYPSIPVPADILAHILDTVTHAPYSHWKFVILRTLANVDMDTDSRLRILDIIRHLHTGGESSDHVCTLLRLYFQTTPSWFHLQRDVIDATFFYMASANAVYTIQFLHERGVLIRPLHDLMSIPVQGQSLTKAVTLQLVRLCKDNLEAAWVQTLLPNMTVSLTAALRLCKDTFHSHTDAMSNFGIVWQRWHHTLPVEIAREFIEVYWSNSLSNSFSCWKSYETNLYESSKYFCTIIHESDIFLWWRWLKWNRYSAASVLPTMLDSLLRLPHVSAGYYQSKCRYIMSLNISLSDDSLLLVAQNWARFGDMKPKYGDSFANILFSRLRNGVSSILTQCFRLFIENPGMKKTPAVFRMLEYLLPFSCPQMEEMRMQLLVTNPKPGYDLDRYILLSSSMSSISHLRLAGCLSRIPKPNMGFRYIHSVCTDLLNKLSIEISKPGFSYDNEYHHLLTLSLKLANMQCKKQRFVAQTMSLLRTMVHAQSVTRRVSPALCEVGLNIAPFFSEFQAYYMFCVVQLLRDRQPLGVYLLAEGLSTINKKMFYDECKNMSHAEVEAMFLYAAARKPSYGTDAVFVHLALESKKLSPLLVQSLFVSDPVQYYNDGRIFSLYPELQVWMQPDCGICMEPMGTKPPVLACHYGFHGHCLSTWWTTSNTQTGTCPLCRVCRTPVPARPFLAVEQPPETPSETAAIIYGAMFYNYNCES